MISEADFTRASAATLQEQERLTKAFLSRMQAVNIIDWDELIALLTTNKAMLGFAATELHRVGVGRDPVETLQQKVINFRQSRERLS